MNSFDAVDRMMLQVLQQEARISMTDLAERVHLSQPATSTRLRRLEEAGVIVGYEARIAPVAIGLTIHAVIRLATSHDRIQVALKQFDSLPEVNRIYRVTGEDCFILDIHAADAGRLEQLIDAIGRFGQVTTSIVLREYPAHPLMARPA